MADQTDTDAWIRSAVVAGDHVVQQMQSVGVPRCDAVQAGILSSLLQPEWLLARRSDVPENIQDICRADILEKFNALQDKAKRDVKFARRFENIK